MHNLIYSLREYNNIFIYTSAFDINSNSKLDKIKSDQWEDTNKYMIYYSSGNKSFSFIRREIKRINPEVIYLNSMFSINYSIKILINLFLGKFEGKIILAPRGMLKKSALEKKWIKKYLYLGFAKKIGLYKNILFHATNNNEKEEIRSIFPGAEVFVIDNLSPKIHNYVEFIEKKINTARLILVGRVHPIKNILFLFEILNGLNSKIDLLVIGNIEDKAYYKKLLDKATEFSANINVSFLGPLEHSEIASELKIAHIFILPTLGENFGHAIIEALSVGRPVLISDQTPWKNLKNYNAGWELPLIDKNAWINAIEEVASWDQKEFERHCEGALEYAKAHINNEALIKKYIEMFSGTYHL